MTKSDEKLTSDRRDFLKLASIGAIASGASVVGGTAQAQEAAAGAGYKVTEHVKTYYELAKF